MMRFPESLCLRLPAFRVILTLGTKMFRALLRLQYSRRQIHRRSGNPWYKSAFPITAHNSNCHLPSVLILLYRFFSHIPFIPLCRPNYDNFSKVSSKLSSRNPLISRRETDILCLKTGWPVCFIPVPHPAFVPAA